MEMRSNGRCDLPSAERQPPGADGVSVTVIAAGHWRVDAGVCGNAGIAASRRARSFMSLRLWLAASLILWETHRARNWYSAPLPGLRTRIPRLTSGRISRRAVSWEHFASRVFRCRQLALRAVEQRIHDGGVAVP